MAYELTIGNHPAARHPVTGKPWFDDQNQPVPLFPEQRSIKLDGYVIAYVSESGNIGFLPQFQNLPDDCVEKAKALVEAEFTEVNAVYAPPDVIEEDELDG